MDPRIERLAGLPQHEGEGWYGGGRRLPAWINDPNDRPGKPWRPRTVLWVSPKAQKVHMAKPAPVEEVTPDRVLDTLLEFAFDKKLTGYRPEAVEVVGGDLARHLVERLEGTG